ncbi:MAG: hypothetical protein AB8B50_08495 [Pirellulaceae bacterium]
MEIQTVRTRPQRRAFVELPWNLYAKTAAWVPPVILDQLTVLDPKKGPFFEHGEAELFIAYRDGKPVGRISAHINFRFDELHGSEKGFFGFFECENNHEVAKALFDKAADYLRSRGRNLIEGPYSFGIYDEIGIQQDAFESTPYILTSSQPHYYPGLVEDNGFIKCIDWYAYRAITERAAGNISEKYSRVLKRLKDFDDLRMRPMSRGLSFPKDAEIVKEIFARAWEQNWSHVPMSDREFARIAPFIRLIVCTELSLIAEKDGKPVGCSLVIYDVNSILKKLNGRLLPLGWLKLLMGAQKVNRARLILMGMLEEYRNRGYDLGFYLHIAGEAAKVGMKEFELSVVVETNRQLLSSLQKLPGVERYKTYRIYQKSI